MKVLAIDSSSIVATVALIEEDKVIGETITNHKKNHSQKLMPIIQELLNRVEVSIKDVDAFGVCIGPGSFTGIRIGVSTAKTLAQAQNKPLVGISTLEGLAFNLPHSEGLICPILDAQRNQIYTALYKWQGSQMTLVEEEQAIEVEAWVENLRNREETIYLIGDGVPKFAPVFEKELKEKVVIAPITARMPRASSIATLALQKIQSGQGSNFKEVLPNYIRKSQAEQSLQSRK